MGTQIGVTVKNKIATGDGSIIVCENKHYSVKFTFDEEWTAYEEKTMRVRFSGAYIDVPFTGDTAPLPIITNTIICEVGVYAGNLETTTPAYFDCKKSILSNSGQQIIPVEPVIEPLEIAENGTYTAPESIDGYSPVTVNIQPPLEEKEITENGEYTPSAGFYGMRKVNVKVGNIPTKGFVPTAWAVDGAITEVAWYGGDIPGNVFYSVGFVAENKRMPFRLSNILWKNPEQITSMGNSAFYSSWYAETFNFPVALKNLGQQVFYGSKLVHIELPPNLNYVDSMCFIDSKLLKRVTFQSIPSYVSESAFQRCTAIETINVPWAEGKVSNAPWGATNATINYNYTGK